MCGKAVTVGDQRTNQSRIHPRVEHRLPFVRGQIVRLFSFLPKTKRSRSTDHSRYLSERPREKLGLCTKTTSASAECHPVTAASLRRDSLNLAVTPNCLTKCSLVKEIGKRTRRIRRVAISQWALNDPNIFKHYNDRRNSLSRFL